MPSPGTALRASSDAILGGRLRTLGTQLQRKHSSNADASRIIRDRPCADKRGRDHTPRCHTQTKAGLAVGPLVVLGWGATSSPLAASFVLISTSSASTMWR